MKKNIKQILVTFSILFFLNTTSVLGQTYRDVPVTHWGYDAVERVSKKGYIIGDMNGNFNLNQKTDKFASSKILAKIAGYKYTNVSQSELTYYQNAYEKNKTLLNAYNAKYSKWNASADREIAYLLEKKVLVASDLNDFVVIVNNREALKAISKEEIAYFMTKAIGKNEVANTMTYTHKFNDDYNISNHMKKNIYYLNKMNILNGDANNNLNPKKAVLKVEFAVIIDKILNNIPSIETSYSEIQIINGEIEKVYPNNNIIQILDGTGKINTYSIAGDAIIKLNNNVSSISKLKEGYKFTGTVKNNQMLLTVNAFTANSNITIDNDDYGILPKFIIEGIVILNTNLEGEMLITIDTKENSLDGNVKIKNYSYNLDTNSVVYKNGVRSTYGNIKIGDIVRAEVKGNKIIKIEVSDPSRVETGELLERKIGLSKKVPILVVKDSNGQIHEYQGTEDTIYHRSNSGTVHFTELLIGDSLDIQLNYDNIVNVYATGKRSQVEGYITSIYIDKSDSYIILKNIDTKKLEKYTIGTRNLNIYNLRINSLVDIILDSKEVRKIDVIENSTFEPITGIITDINRDNFVIFSENDGYVKVYIDNRTTYIDTKNGTTLEYKDIYEKNKVLVYFDISEGNYAQTVNILPQS